MTSKSTSSYARYGCALRRSHANPVERRIGPGHAERERLLGGDDADADRALEPDRVLGEQLVVLVDARLDEVADVRAPTSCQPSGRSAAIPPGRMKLWFMRRPGDHLEHAQRLLALAPAVEHHRDRAEVHAVRRLEQEVRRHAARARRAASAPTPRAVGHLDVEQPLDRERAHELVAERRRVVHAGDVGGALDVRELLAGLLHAGVQVADDRLRPHDASRRRAPS